MAVDPTRLTPNSCYECASGEQRKIIRITDSDTVVYVKRDPGAPEEWCKTTHEPARLAFAALVDREIDCPNYPMHTPQPGEKRSIFPWRNK